jgi:hypothetical protein
MEKETEIYKIPKDDNEIVKFIFKKGKNNLLCVGVNPKSNEINTKNTDVIDKIATENGFDGWFMVNLYPKVEVSASLLEIEVDERLFWENLNEIETVIYKNQFKFKTVWLHWGYEINSFNQNYLKQSAYYLFEKFEKYKLEYVSIGEDINENPLIPSITSNNKFQIFNYKSYAQKIKRTTKILPQITLNGYELK